MKQPAILIAAMVATAFGVVLLYDTFRAKPAVQPKEPESTPMFNTEPEVIQVLARQDRPYGLQT